jgi:tRNA-(ms[2]io[6]A)-hydroxylase
MEAKEKFTLGLELPTDPRWINIAELHIEEILSDHAYCEQKAASACISLITTYPDRNKLVEVLIPIVSEEWSHFERVVAELRKRGFGLGSPRKDEYVDQLMKLMNKGGSRENQLMEKLLLNALIEARSCERFRLLWKNLKDEELSSFYHELMISEAGHYKTFLQLAKEYMPEEIVMARWRSLLEQEAVIVSKLELRGDRMH